METPCSLLNEGDSASQVPQAWKEDSSVELYFVRKVLNVLNVLLLHGLSMTVQVLSRFQQASIYISNQPSKQVAVTPTEVNSRSGTQGILLVTLMEAVLTWIVFSNLSVEVRFLFGLYAAILL